MLLVATATSLPEVVTDVSAALGDAPDLSVGDLFGSSMANMAILAVIDLMWRKRVWPVVEIGHARVASIAIGLTALATLAVLTPPGIALGWVGIDTLAIGAAYVAAVAWMRRSPVARFVEGQVLPVPTGWSNSEDEDDDDAQLVSVEEVAARVDATPQEGGPIASDDRGVRPTVVRFALAAGVILLAGPVLARSGEELAVASGLGPTFVGTALVAISTSLPELVACMAAVRIGAHDLAVGNLFGSNAFNMFALLFTDLAYLDGPVLSAVDPGQAVAGIAAVLLMALALAAIVHGAETRVRRLEPDAVLLLVTYLGALYAVWTVRP
jgi:cation:H+ antiporter